MLFLLPYSGNVPYYLGDAPAGPDAGASVDYQFECEFSPNGDHDVISLIRQVAAVIGGAAKLEIDFKADGYLVETMVVYVQTIEPTSPDVGDYWLDLSQTPDQLRVYRS